MSSLTDIEKRYLEKLLGMESGWVLDFNDARYGEFFARHKIDIHGERYQKYGSSKAKKMRRFWELEPDSIVTPVLAEMIASYEADCEINGRTLETGILEKSKAILNRLGGKAAPNIAGETENSFLDQEFKTPNLQKLPIEHRVTAIVEHRLEEARAALKAKAYLAVILMCGSVLEGVLLGTAQNNPATFNNSSTSPKHSDGKVKKLHEWSLSQLIDTACDTGFLKLDVKKFSHGLRDFRNYIHPYQQLTSGFSPDEHTAKVCFQVLKAALADLAGER